MASENETAETIGMEIEATSGSRSWYAKRWAEQAKKYREAIEARHSLLITQPTMLKRMAVVRFTTHAIHNVREEHFMLNKQQTVGALRQLLVQWCRGNKPSNLRITRVWCVCTMNRLHDETTYDIHNRWQQLIMAKAHRDGRNFHYAKYLMTEKQDQWTDELSRR